MKIALAPAAQSPTLFVTPQMFGALGNWNPNTSTGSDDYPAFAAALAYCNESITTGPPQSTVKLLVPGIANGLGYLCSQTLTPASGVFVEGTPNNSIGVSGATIYNPSGVGALLIPHNTNGCKFVNLSFQGAGGALSHGIHVRRTASFENVSVNGYSGCGFYLNGASDGAGPDGVGFADLSTLRECSTGLNGQCGFYCFGADANVILFDHCSAISNAQHGFRSDGFLGNLFVCPHTSSNGSSIEGVSNCMVSYNGVTWGVVPQYENLALIAPSTTVPGTNSGVWVQIANDTTTFPFVRPWVQGTLYQAGGGYCCLDGSLNLFGYTEGNQGPDYWNGQKFGSPLSQGNFPGVQRPLGYLLPNGLALATAPPSGVSGYETVAVQLAPQNGIGPYNQPNLSIVLAMNGSVTGNGWWLGFNQTNGALFLWNVEDFGVPFWECLGPESTYTYGAPSGNVDGIVNFPGGIGIGASNANPKSGLKMTVNGNGPPTSGYSGRGSIVWNAAATPGGNAGWICTTAGANGSTAVWKPFGTIGA